MTKKEAIQTEFKEKLVDPVKIIMFTQMLECNLCSDTQKIVKDLATLTGKIAVEVYDFLADTDKVKVLGIDKIPALAVIGKKGYGVRIYGVSRDYELQTLLEALFTVSAGKTDLSDKTKTILADIKVPVRIQVFVSLTCPHCPLLAPSPTNLL